MKYILITVDTEFYGGFEEVLGINGRYGIDDMLEILGKYNIKATFFIDYFGVYKWGDDIFQLITDKIKNAGHETELHLHPGIRGGKNLLSEYSPPEQEKYIKEGIELYRKFNGTKPEYFRAGGYGIDENTLKILRKHNIKADFSYQYKQKKCKFKKYPYKNKCGLAENLPQVPVTVYKLKSKPIKQTSVNLDWTSSGELKHILLEIKKSNFNFIVFMAHSFSFLHRFNRKKFFPAPEKAKRLENFIKQAKKYGFKFVSAKEYFEIGGFEENCAGDDFLPEIGNISAIIGGFFVSITNHLILNKKMRNLFSAIIIIFILTAVILWNLL